MRVYLDPETGDLTSGVEPNAVIELDADTQNALRYDEEGLEFVHHANGAVSVDLQERYQSASVVRLDKNGKFIFCSDRIENVGRGISEPVSTPVTAEVK